MRYENIEKYKLQDKICAVCQSLDNVKDTFPTSDTPYSLLVSQQNITKCQLLPLYQETSTDWSNLYAALKIAPGVSISVQPNQKTIVSLDLQLHAKCMQLRENKEVSE